MAIDTAEKRKSTTGIHLYAAGPGVTNNATKDQEWRQEAAYSYSGVLSQSTASAQYQRTLLRVGT